MRDLTLGELQDIQKMASDDNYLRNCSSAFGLVVTYVPALLSMAEKYLRLSMIDRCKSGYSITVKDDSWGISGPGNFFVVIGSGDASLNICRIIVSRLNGLL